MRALLDLIHENEARLQDVVALHPLVLELARRHLKILDPEIGEEELIKAVAAELARLRAISPFESENERESDWESESENESESESKSESESESENESKSESENESKSESENESESESDGEGGLYSRTVSPCESDA